jgi:hypothetical protein
VRPVRRSWQAGPASLHNAHTMIYKFKSAATEDLIMLGPHGDRLLRLLGREPAAKGIIEPAQMLAAIKTLQDAVAAEEPPQDADKFDDRAVTAIGLRQRLWPMIEMLRRCHAADAPVVWGV